MTYQGYTIEQLKEVVDYDPIEGIFTSKVTNKVIVDRRFAYRNPVTKKVSMLYLPRIAVMFDTDSYLDDKDRVTYKDGDIFNLKIDNLVVVTYRDVYKNRFNSDKNSYLETEYPHVFVGSMNKLFVVRRGPDQAVYRTYDKQEAIDVAERWLNSNKTLHEWDTFVPKWYKNHTNEEKCEIL